MDEIQGFVLRSHTFELIKLNQLILLEVQAFVLLSHTFELLGSNLLILGEVKGGCCRMT